MINRYFERPISLKPGAKNERQTERMLQNTQLTLYNYFSKAQQQEATIKVDNNIFKNTKDEPLNGVYLYVVLENKQIIHVKDDGKYFHSALGNGKKVLAAGKLELKKGKLEKVSNESGHYKPTDEEMQYMLVEFFHLANNPNLIYESHCDAADNIVRQYLVSAFLMNSHSLIREIEVNKYITTTLDDDNDDGYKTNLTSRSRFNRNPKPKLESQAKHINKLFSHANKETVDIMDQKLSIPLNSNDSDQTNCPSCPRSCIIL